jgi:hypothetical protein
MYAASPTGTPSVGTGDKKYVPDSANTLMSETPVPSGLIWS